MLEKRWAACLILSFGGNTEPCQNRRRNKHSAGGNGQSVGCVAKAVADECRGSTVGKPVVRISDSCSRHSEILRN